MQKWEYIMVEFNTHDYCLNAGDPIKYERPTEGQSSIKPQVVGVLNKLGRDGWEMVTGEPYYYFKRRISD